MFYSENFSKIEKFILDLNNDRKAVNELKELISNKLLASDLLEIKQFQILPDFMKKLETENFRAIKHFARN